MADFEFLIFPEAQKKNGERATIYPIKGYTTSSGYMGYVAGKYILFPTEDEYINYMRENIKRG